MSPARRNRLNRDPAVDVEVVGAARGESRNDLRRRPGHLFDDASADRGQVDGATAQDHDALVAIRPGPEGQNLLEGLATDHERIDAGDELVVAVGLAAARRQPVEIAVRSRNEAVDAGADKDGDRQSRSDSLSGSLRPDCQRPAARPGSRCPVWRAAHAQLLA